MGTGVILNLQEARNAPPPIVAVRRKLFAPPLRNGRTSHSTIDHMVPETAATVPASAPITQGWPLPDSMPSRISTARAALGAQEAKTAATAPLTPITSHPAAAQNAMTLVPGVTRASAKARA